MKRKRKQKKDKNMRTKYSCKLFMTKIRKKTTKTNQKQK